MGKRTKGVQNLNVSFGRDVPAVLLQGIEWRWSPGETPSLLFGTKGRVEGSFGEWFAQYSKRMEALGVFLGAEASTWITNPHKLLALLASQVFPGCRGNYAFNYDKMSGSKDAPLSPRLVECYVRSVGFRCEGSKKQAALKRAGEVVFPELDGDSVLSKFRRHRRTGILAMFEWMISEYGLQNAAPVIRAFPIRTLAKPVKKRTK